MSALTEGARGAVEPGAAGAAAWRRTPSSRTDTAGPALVSRQEAHALGLGTADGPTLPRSQDPPDQRIPFVLAGAAIKKSRTDHYILK